VHRPSLVTGVIDNVLDRSVVLGYTNIGSSLRRLGWPPDPEPGSMLGKRVVVTGATSGIGEAMARSFAELGSAVHLLGRNELKVRKTAERLRRAVPTADVVEEVCDVADLDLVRLWSADLADRIPELHGLVHNAGAMPPKCLMTAQGHELQLATHVLGPHLMTGLLLPLLQAANGVSSGGMYSAALEADDLAHPPDGYSGVVAYARTKKMQVVLADTWAQRLQGTDVRVESMHPGWAETPGVAKYLPTFRQFTRPLLRDASDGADTAVWLVATRPESTPGHFWHDRAQRPTTFGWQRREDPAKVARFLEQVSAMTGI
jgi:NAD(P)-dependent dehydrogenase (short-subunit alcohol dehydrogenase family)